MQYTYRNAKLTLNGEQLLANSAGFSFSAELDTIFRDNRKNSREFHK